MKILSGLGDYKNSKVDIKVYGYFKDHVDELLSELDSKIVRYIKPRLKDNKNGLRFLSEDGIWHSFIKLEEKDKITIESYRRFGNNAIREAEIVSCKKIAVVIPVHKVSELNEVGRALTEGIVLGSYNYDELKTSDKTTNISADISIYLYTYNNSRMDQKYIDEAKLIADATNQARKLSDTPSNLMTPTIFTNIVTKMAKQEGIKTKVFEKPILEKMGWNAFLGVARGSNEPPKVLILEYNGTKQTSKYAIVGKGITFDSGGISIKPSNGMEEMKFDMAGAASVAMTSILAARLKMPVNLVAIIPLTENMPSGKAQKPGDVIKTLSGKTVEIISTDAEGRLILADALYYAAKTYKPRYIIDLATLTGACVVALGSEASGIMGNENELIVKLINAGEKSGDRLWRLPLWDEYKELLKSDVADIKNSGSRWAGTIQGGIFLKEFVGNTKWAHIDIAGTAYLEKPKAYFKKGATGAGVRLLIRFFEEL